MVGSTASGPRSMRHHVQARRRPRRYPLAVLRAVRSCAGGCRHATRAREHAPPQLWISIARPRGASQSLRCPLSATMAAQWQLHARPLPPHTSLSNPARSARPQLQLAATRLLQQRVQPAPTTDTPRVLAIGADGAADVVSPPGCHWCTPLWPLPSFYPKAGSAPRSPPRHRRRAGARCGAVWAAWGPLRQRGSAPSPTLGADARGPCNPVDDRRLWARPDGAPRPPRGRDSAVWSLTVEAAGRRGRLVADV